MSNEIIQKLKNKRRGYKGALTKIKKTLDILPSPGNDFNISHTKELINIISSLQDIYKKFSDVQTLLESLSKDVDDNERQQFEMQYHELMATALRLSPAHASSSATLSATSVNDSVDQSHGSGCRDNSVQLPKIDVPNFDGDFTNWLEFRDLYLSRIHKNDSIEDNNKLYYLRAGLTSGASSVIKEADNYRKAWQLLSETYDNERLLVNYHVQALFNLEQIQQESCKSLRNMIDVINKNLRALSTLNKLTKEGDLGETLVIYVMSEKLDDVTEKAWEEYKNNLDGFPNLQDYTKFLANKANVLELLKK